MTDRGYLIVAQNTTSVDYIGCARVLAHSIKRVMPHARISILSDVVVNDTIYEHSILFPHGDRCTATNWKLENDWQVYEASPYEQTLKIEADMYIPRSIEHWWECYDTRDLHICTTIRNFRGHISTARNYRGTIDRNKLPDTYNAITYFRRSTIAQDYYAIVRDVFENWKNYSSILSVEHNEIATTDVVYAIAAQIIGREHCTLPDWNHISMTHMKKAINDTRGTDWTCELVAEIHPNVLRINTHPQLYPLHYHVKHFAKTLENEL